MTQDWHDPGQLMTGLRGTGLRGHDPRQLMTGLRGHDPGQLMTRVCDNSCLYKLLPFLVSLFPCDVATSSKFVAVAHCERGGHTMCKRRSYGRKFPNRGISLV